MDQDIQAIFLDMGDTLRIHVPDPEYQAQARKELARLIGTTEAPDAFCARLDARYETYRAWAFETLNEASEKELWTRWLLPDFPVDQIAPLAGALTYQFRQSAGRRMIQPHAPEVIAELSRRGYDLGIVSNTITEREIPAWLQANGIASYFKTVVLSAVFGKRKPDPAIYLEATRQAGIAPARSAYVGNNPARDVDGARRAGFGMIVILMEPAALAQEPLAHENRPDCVIHQFRDLLNIFPPRAR